MTLEIATYLFVTSTESSDPQNGIALLTPSSTSRSCALLFVGPTRITPKSSEAKIHRRESLVFVWDETTIVVVFVLYLIFNQVHRQSRSHTLYHFYWHLSTKFLLFYTLKLLKYCKFSNGLCLLWNHVIFFFFFSFMQVLDLSPPCSEQFELASARRHDFYSVRTFQICQNYWSFWFNGFFPNEIN